MLTLVSHHLCPYVQRASIALDEKGVRFERTYIDLKSKPDWFLKISPLGKVPLPGSSGDIHGLHLVADRVEGRRRRLATVLASRVDAARREDGPDGRPGVRA